MCIIAAKAAGIKMPDRKIIRTMWYGNPDGAGVMYAKDGKVRIDKGFMTPTALEKHLDKLEKTIDTTATPIVMHFRITTHGGTKPENTHPFPITDSVKRLQLTHCTAKLGVAHNGIIDIKPRSSEISDTMEYIASQLAPLSRALPMFYKNMDAMTMIQNAINSKMVFLTGEGELYSTGDFVEEDGILYSNTSFRGRQRYTYDFHRDWFYSTTTATKPKAPKGKSKEKRKAKRIDAPSPQELMWIAIASDGAYVICEDGTILEGDDFLIDVNLNVYLYDAGLDACSLVPNAAAFTGSGLPMRFNPDYASDELVLPF